MCATQHDNYFVGFLIGVFAFFTMILFYVMIILPRDQVGFAIMACMGSDHSPESYEMCRLQITGGETSPVTP